MYISANPSQSIEWKSRDHFFKNFSVWDFGWRSIEGIDTVPPEIVSEVCRKNLALYPEKRLFVHYLQPHEPYIGNVKLSLDDFNPWRKFKRTRLLPPLRGVLVNGAKADPGNALVTFLGKSHTLKKLMRRLDKLTDGAEKLWRRIDKLTGGGGFFPQNVAEALNRGMCDFEVFKKAYKENLNLVLNSVDSLLERIKQFRKSIVITSDHGELFREPFGHQMRLSPEEYPELFEVPWFEVK